MKKKNISLLFGAMLALTSCGGSNTTETKHSLTKVDEVPATCLEDGTREYYVCSEVGCEGLCFDSKGNQIRRSSLLIEALGHDFQEDPQLRYMASLPSCQSKGKYFEACTRCGTKGTKTFESGDTLPHVYGDVVIEPTIGGTTETHKNNTFIIEYTASKSCENCSHIESETKVGELVIEPAKDATCTTDGEGKIVVNFSKEFGGDYSKDVVIDKTGHNVEGVAYSVDENKHWKVCKNCEEKVDEGNHEFNHKHNDTEHWEECETCAKAKNKENHVFGERVVTLVDFDSSKVSATLTCTNPDCKYEKSEEKTGTINVVKPAGCETAGSATVSVTFSEEFGGAYNDSIVLPAKGHTSDKILDHDADNHFYHCSDCGDPIEVKAHSASSYNVITYPTDTEPGQREGTCDVCAQAFTQSFSQCETGKHVGDHFTGKEPTKLESGFSGFYYCDACHKIILDNDHVEGDGTWSEKGEATGITKGHKAYLEPTVTKEDVEEKLALLESTVAIDSNPGALDKQNYEKALQYKNVYMTKEGSVEADLIGIDNLYGAANVLSYKNSTPFSTKINEWNVHTRNNIPLNFDQKDVDTGFEYTRYEISSELSGFDFLYYYQGGILEDLPDKPLQVYIRSNTSIAICSRVFDKTSDLYGTKTILVENEWTPITFSTAQVAIIKGLVADAHSGGNPYYGNAVRINISQTAIPANTVVDFTTFYNVNDLDLPSYNVLSSEKYGEWWNLAPLSGTLTTDLHNNNWFAGVKAPDVHPSYRDYFLETKYSNNTGNVLVANEDYRYDGTDNLSCIFFRHSAAVVKSFTEVIYMVYSNEQVEINSTKLGLLNKWDTASVITETTLYKGWNALHLDVSKISSTDGLYTFTMVPKKWSTTLQITTTAMFYKVAD